MNDAGLNYKNSENSENGKDGTPHAQVQSYCLSYLSHSIEQMHLI